MMVSPVRKERWENARQTGRGPGAGPCRRCIVSGEVVARERLVRFVVGPDGRLVPDVEGTLPGRGLWLSARRDVLNTACARNLFAKAAHTKVVVGADLADQVEHLLARRCLDLVGLARRAGFAAAGFERVRDLLRAGRAAVVIAASDGAEGGRAKLRALAPHLPLIDVLGAEELGAALGSGRLVHAALAHGRLAERVVVEAGRLAGFRAGAGGRHG
ncbi:MAG: RNA-binding protein [Alphaproteobacteria bacterium]